MKFGTKMYSNLLTVSVLFCLILCASCTYSTSNLDNLKPDDQPKLVVHGHMYPQGIELAISRSVPTGEQFQGKDLILGETVECSLWTGDSLVSVLTYIPILDRYKFDGTLAIDLTYKLTVNSPGLPAVEISQLVFSEAALDINTGFFQDTLQSRSFPLLVEATITAEAYYLIVPLLEEQTNTNFQRLPFVNTDYDALYEDECGIVNAGRQVGIATGCSVDNKISIDADGVVA